MTDTAPLADPSTLLGRLQRGRGSAIRTVLAEPSKAEHRAALTAILTTRGYGDLFASYAATFAELVGATALDLAPWFDAIERLTDDARDEADALFHTIVLGERFRAGDERCRQRLFEFVRSGPHHWLHAAYELDPEMEDAHVWGLAVERMDDEELRIHYRPDRPVWVELERTSDRVARHAAERRAAYPVDRYESAGKSSARWQIMRLHANAPDASAWITEGLWDASLLMRRRCIERADLSDQLVRERLRELCDASDEEVARAARRRVEE